MDANYGGRFVLLDRVGAGGMAEVWKARMQGRAGLVAVKRILPEHAHDRYFRDMFLQEARICARLDHPNLVHVYDFGEAGDDLWLAMEYVEGKNFYDVLLGYLRRQERPPVGLSAYVAQRLCRGLAHAHSLTDDEGRALLLVHRDVSPGNVMLGYDGEVKLLDFGVAKLLADHQCRTHSGVVKGKSGYMAPERLASLPIDGRADLFSAGVLLYEALSGKRLFAGVAPGTVVDSLFDRAVDTPPSQHNPEVPQALDAICRRALARDVEDRFPDGEAMAAELEAVVQTLGWSEERAAHTVRELFSLPGDAPDPTLVPSVTRLPATVVRRRRVWPWALPILAAMAIGGWLVAARGPAPVVEPPLVVKEPPLVVKEPPPVVKEPPLVVKEPPLVVKEPPKRKRPHHSPARRAQHPLDGSEVASPF